MEKHELSEEEKIKVTAQVDYFMDLIAKKYAVNPNEVLEAVKWVSERKAQAERLKSTALLSLLGIIISAVMFAVWEGLKAIIRRGA